MEIVGKIQELSPLESGQSEKGAWCRRTLVVKTLDQNPVTIAFSCMGLRLSEAEKHSVGEIVRIRFGVSSRNVNGRWFNDIQLWGIQQV